MKTYIYFIIITLALTVATFFWGRASVDKPDIVNVVAEVNVDSLRGVWLEGKVESSELAVLAENNSELKKRIAYLKAHPDKDTVLITEIRDVVPTVRFDTVLATNVGLSLYSENDTISTTNRTNLHFRAEYLGSPWSGLYISNLSIDPIKQVIPMKERVIKPSSSDLFSLHALVAHGQQGLGAGIYGQVGMFGAGMILQYDTHPLYFLSLRVIK